MVTSSLRLTVRWMVILALTGAVTLPNPLASQQIPFEAGPGIWIADESGSLQEVELAESFLARAEPRPARGSTEIVFLVHARAGSATGALADGRLRAERVRAAIAGSGIGIDEFRSRVAYVEPRYRRQLLLARWESPRMVGYDAVFVVTVRTRTSRLGRLIDAAVGAGATAVPEVGSPR